MPSIYDIYERKNYRNRISLDRSVSFEVEVRETNLHIQAHSDLNAKAKDSVFRYRYQIEEIPASASRISRNARSDSDLRFSS